MKYERNSMQEQNNKDNEDRTNADEDRTCAAENDEDKSPKENEKDLANKGTKHPQDLNPQSDQQHVKIVEDNDIQKDQDNQQFEHNTEFTWQNVDVKED
ncbi:hypothetical protein TIFTF001_044289 [Ficus carica]|uniref:Uncharacterized protein n=1 Tax=Ficus carica TaxID=3494 RepID=A0AA87ZAK8_FICCA|nr:hypothetical protein TIFTF001_044289 [Ficus carica]